MILRVKIYEESFKFFFINTNVFHNFFLSKLWYTKEK